MALEHLLKIAAVKRHPISNSRFADLSLFREDGSFELLQADRELVREALAAADGNMLWIDVESSRPTAALVQGWPRPWRSGALTLDAVEEDEMVSLYRRLKRPARGSGHLYLDTWIRIVGSARAASMPLVVDASQLTSNITAGDVALPPGCHLLSDPEQVLVRIVRAQEATSHA